MEGGYSVLDSVFEDEKLEDFKDVEMLDVEDGEMVEQNPEAETGKNNSGTDVKVGNLECRQDNPGQRKNRKKNKNKNKRKRGNSGPNVTDINRFVPDVCRHLKERKSYLVWAAVGCLGVSALNDLVKEVNAIQDCGGQKTADGKLFRTGGGILWNILKVRDPNAYKEIMRRGKDFEKQFKLQNIKQENNQGDSSQKITHMLKDSAKTPDGSHENSLGQNQLEQSSCGQKRVSVHDRVRIPVAYDDLLGDE